MGSDIYLTEEKINIFFTMSVHSTFLNNQNLHLKKEKHKLNRVDGV